MINICGIIYKDAINKPSLKKEECEKKSKLLKSLEQTHIFILLHTNSLIVIDSTSYS